MKKLFALLMAAMMLLCCVACGGGNDTPDPSGNTTASITIGTGSTSGTYYAYTNAVGMILKDATGYTYNVISTGGSVANINGIEDGDYNMAIVQNDTRSKPTINWMTSISLLPSPPSRFWARFTPRSCRSLSAAT